MVAACSETPPTIENLQGCLLYIEDVDGSGGTTAGDFGDIIAFNPKTNTEFRITSDEYYDRNPTYSPSLNEILFESKRIGASKVAGLTSKSDLFLIKLPNKNPQRVNINGPLINSKLNLYDPEFDNRSQNFAFLSHNTDNIKHTNLYYSSDSLMIRLLLDSLNGPLTYTFGETDGIIFFTSKEKYTIGTSKNYIGSVDIKTSQVDIVLPPREGNFYYLGDEVKDRLLFLSRDISDFDDLTNISINLFDLESHSSETISTSHQLGLIDIESPVFASDSIIYFIGNKAAKEGEFDDDIYSLNINSKVVKRITNNGHIKENLSFCK